MSNNVAAAEKLRLVSLSAVDAEAELDRVVVEIDEIKTYLDTLYEQRAMLFHALFAAGWRQADVARKAKVTPMAVSFAIERFPLPQSA